MNGAVGDGSKALVVGHNDEGLTEFLAQFEEELVQFGLVFAVETARRFVSQDDSRAVYEGPGHCHTLLFSARKLGRLMACAVGKAHESEQFQGTLPGFGCVLAGDVGWNHDVFKGCELGQKLVELKHKADVAVAEVAEFAR